MSDDGRVRWDVRRFLNLESTNTTLRELAAAGAPGGTVVIADEQTAGRGRRGRSWHSPAGAGLYGSLLVRPALAAHEVGMLTFVAAVAVAEALADLGLAAVEIKWPNDVLARGRKVCGILTEASFLEDRVEWAVVGIGVNLTDEAVPPDLGDRATSLEAEGVRATNVELLDSLLDSFDRWYAVLADRGAGAVLDRWTELAPMARDHAVVVDDGRELYEATTEGVAPDGVLHVRRDDGRLVELSAADVTLRAPR
jgi:BirA family biotin operon repressor/biotin-[acetyl-CoA-carboxylase] ligase